MVAWEQGRLFTRLFAGDGEGAGTSASLSRKKSAAGIAMIEALAEQLTPRVLAGSQWPLQAVLYLPRLGRINASVRREQSGWAIELEAEHDARPAGSAAYGNSVRTVLRKRWVCRSACFCQASATHDAYRY